MADLHGKVRFNSGHVKNVSKEQFVDDFKNVYPHLDLPAEYDKIVGPVAKDPVKKQAPKKRAKK